MIAFTENLGEVSIEIRDSGWVVMDFAYVETPTGYQYYITTAGRYTVFLRFENGDEYYGDFEVTD